MEETTTPHTAKTATAVIRRVIKLLTEADILSGR
jgi:hypothetical protein